MAARCLSTATGSARACTAASPAAAAARRGACLSDTSGATRATHLLSAADPADAGDAVAAPGRVPPPCPLSTYSANSSTPVLARGARAASSDASSEGRMASAGKASPTAASAADASPRTLSLESTSRGNSGGHSRSSSGSSARPAAGTASTTASSTACATRWCGSPTCATKASASSRAREDASEAHRRPPARSAAASASNAAVFASHDAVACARRPEPWSGEPRARSANAASSAEETETLTNESPPPIAGSAFSGSAERSRRRARGASREAGRREAGTAPSVASVAPRLRSRVVAAFGARDRPPDAPEARVPETSETPPIAEARRAAAAAARLAVVAMPPTEPTRLARSATPLVVAARADARSAPPPTRATPRPESREASTPTRRPPLAATVLGRSNSRVSVGPGRALVAAVRGRRASSADAARSRSSSSCTPAAASRAMRRLVLASSLPATRAAPSGYLSRYAEKSFRAPARTSGDPSATIALSASSTHSWFRAPPSASHSLTMTLSQPVAWHRSLTLRSLEAASHRRGTSCRAWQLCSTPRMPWSPLSAMICTVITTHLKSSGTKCAASFSNSPPSSADRITSRCAAWRTMDDRRSATCAVSGPRSFASCAGNASHSAAPPKSSASTRVIARMRSVHSCLGSSCSATRSISLDSSRSESTCAARGGAPSAMRGTTPVARPYGGGSSGSAGAAPPESDLAIGRSPPATVAGRASSDAACARVAEETAGFPRLPARLNEDAPPDVALDVALEIVLVVRRTPESPERERDPERDPDVAGRAPPELCGAARSRVAPSAGDATRLVTGVGSSPRSLAWISFICPGRTVCFCSSRSTSPPAAAAAASAATTAQIAASRTAGSRSSSARAPNATIALTGRDSSPASISRSSSAKARSTTRSVSSRTRQFLCRHAGDASPTSSAGATAPELMSARKSSRPASRTGALASPSLSKAPGRMP